MAEMGVKPMNKAKEKVGKPKTVKRTVKKLPSKPPQVRADERVQTLERKLALAEEERSQAEEEISALKKKLRASRKKVTALQEAAQQSTASLAEILHQWGFETPVERAALLRNETFLERIIAHPSLEEDVGLRKEIAQKVSRVCSECEPPSESSPIHVKAAHCIVCGGVDMEKAARMFTDAALLNGRLRIVIVGRTTMHHRLLRRHIGTDKRMVLTQLPGDIRRDPAAAQTDVDHADVVIVWDPNSVEPALLSVYESGAYSGSVAAGSVGALLQESARIVGAH